HDAVVVHPGSAPQRVAFSGAQQVIDAGTPAGTVGPGTVAAGSIAAAVDHLATVLAGNPWRERVALALADVVAVADAGRWWLQDPAGGRLPLASSVEPWELLAVTGGSPATVVVEWEPGGVSPMTVVAAADRVVPL